MTLGVAKSLVLERGRATGQNRLNTENSKTIDISTPELDFSRSRYPAISLQSAEVAVPKSDSKSVAYENRTKSAKCGGLETNGPRERISGPDRGAAVRRFLREAHGYWASMRARKPAENVLRGRTGGGRETVDLSFQKCVGDQCDPQGRDGVASANCESAADREASNSVYSAHRAFPAILLAKLAASIGAGLTLASRGCRRRSKPWPARMLAVNA